MRKHKVPQKCGRNYSVRKSKQQKPLIHPIDDKLAELQIAKYKYLGWGSPVKTGKSATISIRKIAKSQIVRGFANLRFFNMPDMCADFDLYADTKSAGINIRMILLSVKIANIHIMVGSTHYTTYIKHIPRNVGFLHQHRQYKQMAAEKNRYPQRCIKDGSYRKSHLYYL